jgi:hypothetical protein
MEHGINCSSKIRSIYLESLTLVDGLFHVGDNSLLRFMFSAIVSSLVDYKKQTPPEKNIFKITMFIKSTLMA